jgi:hypothetical protein
MNSANKRLRNEEQMARPDAEMALTACEEREREREKGGELAKTAVAFQVEVNGAVDQLPPLLKTLQIRHQGH